MAATGTAPTAGQLFHRPNDTGLAFWGPDDHYRFLVTGEESGGAYFAMEALVWPGGGPPPHIHRREDETFYVLDGEMEFRLEDEVRSITCFEPKGSEAFFREFVDVRRPEAFEMSVSTRPIARVVEGCSRFGMILGLEGAAS